MNKKSYRNSTKFPFVAFFSTFVCAHLIGFQSWLYAHPKWKYPFYFLQCSPGKHNWSEHTKLLLHRNAMEMRVNRLSQYERKQKDEIEEENIVGEKGKEERKG